MFVNRFRRKRRRRGGREEGGGGEGRRVRRGVRREGRRETHPRRHKGEKWMRNQSVSWG
tara:strand:- start:2647 stop:2823 length:177 start_codon:yes stop_codon:yes gene_type:complete